MKLVKKSFKYIILLVVLGLVYVGYNQYPRLNIIAGYSAKNMSSSVFVAGREADFTDATDNNFSPVNIADDEVDIDAKSVESSVYGLMKRKAIYREGLGSVLITKDYDENTPFLVPKRVKTKMNLPFPYGELPQKDTIFQNVDYKKLNEVVLSAFDSLNKTRVVLVVYKNHIIAEEYANKFDKNSKILGWSMAKSLTSAVYGVMNKQGRLNKDEFAPIDAWKKDERSKITLNNLLQMNSGLEWEEDYTKISDAVKMLYLEPDMTKLQIDKQFVGKPNETWCYSSGTTNLLSGILRQKFKTHQDYLDFWYTDLIDKIGMSSMLVETDLSGNYVGSSYAWATPRDWAKFGLLYLHNGNWNGEQIISKDWVKYTRTPTNTSEGVYGAQFWLNAGGHLPDVPKDLFFADGYQGQSVFIIPSKDLVVVRMGLSLSNLDEQLKNRPIKSFENEEIVKFELNNKASNDLLKNIISAIN